MRPGRELNHGYRGKDAATNVLSFALNEGEDSPADLPLFGDIVLCAQWWREAAEQRQTLHAHYAHLTVHGVLHLCGHDHEDDSGPKQWKRLKLSSWQG